MIRRNREINIFSMSVLDLFASALGAFILLTLILLPYYLKTDKSQAALLRAQQQQIAQLQQQNQNLQQQASAMQSELENAVSFALLGITTKAKSFVLVIDMSGSMQKYTAIMVKTVTRVLEPMKDENQIQIIGYQGEDPKLHSWRTPHHLADMDSSSKQSALRWAEGLAQAFDGGTPTHTALIEALQYPAEAVILLTDGAPNDSEPAEIIRDITARNGGDKEIHTVALGEYRSDPKLVAFLEDLAKANNGGFVGVAN